MRAATLPLPPPFSAIWNASPFVQRALIDPAAANGDVSTPVAGNATPVAVMMQSLVTVAVAEKLTVPATDCAAHVSVGRMLSSESSGCTSPGCR